MSYSSKEEPLVGDIIEDWDNDVYEAIEIINKKINGIFRTSLIALCIKSPSGNYNIGTPLKMSDDLIECCNLLSRPPIEQLSMFLEV